jgi:uncharacterized protein (DUF433 family)
VSWSLPGTASACSRRLRSCTCGGSISRLMAVTVDPDNGFRRPRFARGGGNVEDVIDLFRSGEHVDTVPDEFRLSRDEVEDAIRVVTRVTRQGRSLDHRLLRRAVFAAFRRFLRARSSRSTAVDGELMRLVMMDMAAFSALASSSSR